MKSPRIVAGIILAFCLLFPAHASPSEFTGKTITRIDIKDDQGKPWPRPEQVLALITLHPGASYSGPAVRDSISLLYLKGIFRDIRVDAFPEENGVRLEFVLFPTTIVGKIAVHGNDAVSTSAITDAVASLEGKELRDEKLSAARTDILALYAAIPTPVRMLAKKQLRFIPIFGWGMAVARFVFIDRVKCNPSFLPYFEPSIAKVRGALARLRDEEDMRWIEGMLDRAFG